jgi:hypothetical protein
MRQRVNTHSGTVSGQNLGGLVFGKQVIVQYDDLDRYGHILGKAIIKD